ncbi:hypothetical protein K1T71_003996 [Dendrolimus kikuchii]|uniref:Uncharacterized protein n=1 Tax=Dendrolimus kikuchii TaxID=765133 RepID=A0ACC1DB08_9NEOP|nr:hypothetical protein K1T71_003996 [Dendrolimus kikuchii]
MADIKALLKEARKLINDKNFKEAQECCKNILRQDKQNYFALILLGKSLEDSVQAPLAFQKAISAKPDQPLAWQGLANYYERKNDNLIKPKLFPIYKQMLNMEIEEEKSLELIQKIGQLACTLKNSEALSILSKFISTTKKIKLIEEAQKQLIFILKSEIPCKEEDIQSILTILKKIRASDPSETIELLQCKVIIQRHDFYEALQEIIRLDFFSQNITVKEWLCQQLCMKYVENMSFCNFDIKNNVDEITEGITNSKYPALLRSMISYDEGLYFDAYKQSVPLINFNEADVTEATFIINCTIKLKKWSVTQKLTTIFLNKVKDEKFTLKLQILLFISLAKQYKWKEAISVIQNISLESLMPNEQALLAECHIQTNESADQIIQNLKSTEYQVQLQSMYLIKQHKFEEVIKLLENDTENKLSSLYLGKAFWELKDYDKCHLNLLKAAKLNPDNADVFLYLGNLYYKYKNDLEKAKKCYEKAYNLDSINYKITKKLSEVYIKLNQMDNNYQLLNILAKNVTPDHTWVYFRLGLHYLNKREWENAIINFRNVIKSDHTDTTAFECLADAYYSRGSYTSASKAYSRVMAIDPSKSVHCLSRIGYIHSLLTQYEDAILTFEKVLVYDPHSLLALKGIAETWIRIAKKKVTAKIYGSARDCAQQAVNYITKCIITGKQYTCFWKLLGDTLMFITKLPNKYAYVYMSPLNKNASSGETKIDKLDLFPQAIACYSYITKQKQIISSYDLASAYLSYYHETNKKVNCQLSFNLTVKCIEEKPSVWRNWNLLGKVCIAIKKYNLSQHCFIKAITTTRKWSVAKIWCNLGTLYLKLKLYKLANYCFWRGQSTLPSYPHSWIGQGLIAEVIREEEAMDLLRHASRLGYHSESAFGYADWVCRTLNSNKSKDDPESKYAIEGLYAITYAIDLLEWYCNFEASDACAYTILGILQERNGLYKTALKSYENALKFCDESRKNITLLNLGRIFLRTEHYDEAVQAYKAITEASLDSTIGLALALLKKGLYEEAYAAYDTALHWLSNDDNEKADILVAMAGIVYMYKGAEDAKTLLFHSIQISQKKPTAYSLFAICSLGLIHSDQSLSKLAISELQKYKKESDFGFDIGFLKSYMFVCENDIERAIKLLSDSIHDYPSNALLWFCMAQYCLRNVDVKPKVASCCAQKALCCTKYGHFDCNAAKIIASASIAEHLAGDRVKAFILAKEGLHMYPNQSEIWAALLLSLVSNKTWTERKYWLLTAAGHMRRHLNISRPMSRWVSLIEKKLCK